MVPDRLDASRKEPLYRIVGICGTTSQALSEATIGRDLRYDLEISFEESAFGCEKVVKVPRPVPCATCR